MSQEVLSVELPKAPVEVSPRHVVYMAGATDTHRKLYGVESKLTEEFGKENVTIWPSILSSILFGDRPEKNRFKTIGENLKDKIEKGPTTIAAHSLGAAEMLASFEEIKKTDPDFFKDPKTKENLSAVLISPTILKNAGAGLRYISKFGTLGIQELGVLRYTLPKKKTGILQGIVSISLLPPKDETIDYENLATKLRAASNNFSRYNDTIHDISHKPDDTYYASIPNETLNLIHEQDEILANASVDTPGGKKQFRKALRKRGKLTRKTVVTIFDRTHQANSNEPNIEPEKPKKNKEASRQRRKFLHGTFLKGKTHTRFHALIEDLGDEAKIKISVPEYDLVMKADKAEQLMRGKKENVVTITLSTHTSPWTLEPGVLVDLVSFANS